MRGRNVKKARFQQGRIFILVTYKGCLQELAPRGRSSPSNTVLFKVQGETAWNSPGDSQEDSMAWRGSHGVVVIRLNSGRGKDGYSITHASKGLAVGFLRELGDLEKNEMDFYWGHCCRGFHWGRSWLGILKLGLRFGILKLGLLIIQF
jgi:hypothetical protein